MVKEIWKDICGCEGIYQVSNLGRVRGLPRIRNSSTIYGDFMQAQIKGRVLKPRYSKIKKVGFVNYPRVSLRKNGVSKNFCIHKLVAIAFIPNPENKNQVDHIDCNPLNNNVKNLRWVTQSENNNNPKTRKKRCLLYNGEIARDIAKRNGISRSTFSVRIHYGWSLEDAIKKEIKKKRAV